MANLFTAYARVKYPNADIGGFSPLQFSPSLPEQQFPQRTHQSSSQVLPPAPLHSHQAVRGLAPSPSAASYGSTISIPRSNVGQDPVVARVISRHYISGQVGGHVHYGTFYLIFVIKKILLLTGKDTMTKSPYLMIFFFLTGKDRGNTVTRLIFFPLHNSTFLNSCFTILSLSTISSLFLFL
jgi:hypothetical protein